MATTEEIAKKITNVMGTEIDVKSILQLPNDKILSKQEVYATRVGDSVVVAYVYADGTTSVKIL